jgi:hypothetical protein
LRQPLRHLGFLPNTFPSPCLTLGGRHGFAAERGSTSSNCFHSVTISVIVHVTEIITKNAAVNQHRHTQATSAAKTAINARSVSVAIQIPSMIGPAGAPRSANAPAGPRRKAISGRMRLSFGCQRRGDGRFPCRRYFGHRSGWAARANATTRPWKRADHRAALPALQW